MGDAYRTRVRERRAMSQSLVADIERSVARRLVAIGASALHEIMNTFVATLRLWDLNLPVSTS